ncbi:MAG: ATP-binding protein [Marmoricola sp.]
MDPALTVSALDAWASSAFEQVAAVPNVHRAGLAVVEGGGRQLLFTATERLAEETLQWCHIDTYDDVPLTTAVRRGSIVAGALDALDPRFSAFARSKQGSGSEAIAAIPLTAGESVLGGCILYFDRPQSFDADQATLLRELGTSLGARLAHARRSSRKRVRHLPPVDSASDLHVLVEVPADVSAVPTARAQARLAMLDWGLEVESVDNALLCLSEIVTNAIIHTDGGCQVELCLAGGVLTVRVRDDGTATTVSSVPGGERLPVRGRGLQIVQALADRSGRDEDASVSWFELDVKESGGAQPTGGRG